MNDIARYLLRLDDLCPTMEGARWQRFFDLIEEFELEPILAVVPDNRDPDLDQAPVDPAFWSRLRALEAKGAAIALHGLHHQPLMHGRSLLPLHRETEFAGAGLAEQRRWIHAGLELLRAQQLHPGLWVAPRHGFDRNTLKALRAEGIDLLSDGFARRPYLRGGLTWLPQQLWGPVEKRTGLWTICLHPNTATEAQVKDLRSFLAVHAGEFVSVERALISFPPRPYGRGDWFEERWALGRRRLSRIAKILRK
jgi:predicted deacetylase